MIHPKLEIIANWIAGKMVAANVDVLIEDRSEGDCDERLSAIEWLATGIPIHNVACNAFDQVIYW